MINFEQTTKTLITVKLSSGKVIGAIFADESGYKHFWPYLDNRGYWSEEFLHIILSKLAELNREWDKDINDYFDNSVRMA